MTQEECKGWIYRCTVNNYMDNKFNYSEKTFMRKLIKQSCKGCKDCWFLEEGAESAIVINDPVNGGLYQLNIIPGEIDYETNCADDFELEFERLTETT